jgi:hypothetical protein
MARPASESLVSDMTSNKEPITQVVGFLILNNTHATASLDFEQGNPPGIIAVTD